VSGPCFPILGQVDQRRLLFAQEPRAAFR